MNKKRSALVKYYGAKGRIAKWIVSHMPQHTTYVEPYAGAASVLFTKPKSKMEVYNDIDNEVVNVFRVLRDRKACHRLIRLIEQTPFSRSEYKNSAEYVRDPVEKARRTIVRAWMSYGSTGISREEMTGSFRTSAKHTTYHKRWGRLPKDIRWYNQRFKDVIVECLPAVKLIPLYDSEATLFYIDPPYLADARKCKRDRYRYEMEEADHVELAETLKQCKGSVIISGYDSPLYADLYAGWGVEQTATRAFTNEERIETLWISPNAYKQTQLRFE